VLQRLLNADSRPECFVSANLPINKQKNRLVNVLPCQFVTFPLCFETHLKTDSGLQEIKANNYCKKIIKAVRRAFI